MYLSRISKILLIHTCCYISSKAQDLENEYGVLVVEPEGENSSNPQTDHLFCVVYYPSIRNITSKEKATKYDLQTILDLGQKKTCDGNDLSDAGVHNKFGYINGSSNLDNCSIAERAITLQEYQALGLITDRIISNKFNQSEFNISIDVFTLVEKNARKRIEQFKQDYPGGSFYVYDYGGDDRSFDASLVVILLMAVLTVIIGSLWSGYAKHSLRQKKERREPAEGVADCGVQPQDGTGGQDEELSVHVSPLLVIFFVCCMCSMLVLLYFFFNQLVYVIMGMFCIASSLAMYSCLEPVVMASYSLACLPVLRLPRCNLYICILQLELRQLLLLLLSLGTAITWFCFRKSDWSWILQDLLGIMFSINMLKVLRLPSLKICTILLSALFFYDIFFVFITPLFMEGGKSVMVEVATGHSSDEQLPMVLRVPHLSNDPSRVCYVHTYSLLGFGDILVPGLLLSFAHSYDLQAGIKYKLYWLITTSAYILGLIATFISLFLMNSAQPALLYLVPFTLVPTVLVAWLRGDLPAMWQGDIKDEGEVLSEEENDDKENVTTEETSAQNILTDNLIGTPDKNQLLEN